jgi:phage shock protein A
MGIFSRFSDIINANINSMLDNAEDPEKMVRLIIQEMEETLVEVRTNSARIIADKKELNRRSAWLARQAEDWEQKAELAISKDREDLARAALAEKLKLEDRQAELEEELQQIEGSLDALNDEIGQLQLKLNEAKNRQNAIVVRQKSASSRLKIREQVQRSAVKETLSKFEQYERKLDDLESQVEAYDLGRPDLADEIDQLSKKEDIDNELEQLKKRLKGEQAESNNSSENSE